MNQHFRNRSYIDAIPTLCGTWYNCPLPEATRCLAYDAESGAWNESYQNTVASPASHAAALHPSLGLLLFDRRNGLEAMATMDGRRFVSDRKATQPPPPLLNGAYGRCVAVVGDDIYALGGSGTNATVSRGKK